MITVEVHAAHCRAANTIQTIDTRLYSQHIIYTQVNKLPRYMHAPRGKREDTGTFPERHTPKIGKPKIGIPTFGFCPFQKDTTS